MIFPVPLHFSRRFRDLFVLIFAALLAAFLPARQAPAQSFDATTLRQPANLGMNWLVHAGDDPAYAKPDFDDSHWMVVDPGKSLKTYFPSQHPNVIWYRLHVKVAPHQTGLALGEWSLSSAFDIYINGNLVMQSGSINPYVPYLETARLLRPIPDAEIATGALVIAQRVYVSPHGWAGPFPGFYSQNLSIGQQKALSDHIWLTVIGEQALDWFYDLGGLGLGLIALALFTAQRQQREYLWIFLLFMTLVVSAPLSFYLLFHNVPTWETYLNGAMWILVMVFQVKMYLAFLRIKLARWIQVWMAAAAAGLISNVYMIASQTGSSTSLLASAVPWYSLTAGVIPVLLLIYWRRGNGEAGILLIPAIVSSLSIYLQFAIFLAASSAGFERVFEIFQWIINWTVGPFTVNLGNLGNCMFLLSLAIILVLRATRIAHQQAQIETEMAAAREVQKIILPEQIDSVSGFAIETAYEPAQQVGGDFFQILPAPEGSLLLVIGDVAGKGLPAAMLVSVLVGAIRGVSEYTSNPAELLANLNQRSVGRVAGSLTTALAARIFPDGAVMLSNAGHLPPYLDGKEVEVPGALPLGAHAGTQYETVRFLLPRGSRLTFYSDGIVEAQNAAGELFGFERSGSISMQPVAQIIEAAKLHGQCDDMTAISITRAAAAEARPKAVEAAPPALGIATL